MEKYRPRANVFKKTLSGLDSIVDGYYAKRQPEWLRKYDEQELNNGDTLVFHRRGGERIRLWTSDETAQIPAQDRDKVDVYYQGRLIERFKASKPRAGYKADLPEVEYAPFNRAVVHSSTTKKEGLTEEQFIDPTYSPSENTVLLPSPRGVVHRGK